MGRQKNLRNCHQNKNQNWSKGINANQNPSQSVNICQNQQNLSKKTKSKETLLETLFVCLFKDPKNTQIVSFIVTSNSSSLILKMKNLPYKM